MFFFRCMYYMCLWCLYRISKWRCVNLNGIYLVVEISTGVDVGVRLCVRVIYTHVLYIPTETQRKRYNIKQCSTQIIAVVNGIIKYHPIVIQIVMIVEGKMISYKERYEINRCVRWPATANECASCNVWVLQYSIAIVYNI